MSLSTCPNGVFKENYHHNEVFMVEEKGVGEGDGKRLLFCGWYEVCTG